MLPMSNMAQLPKHRCQNYSANNKTQVHHKAARPHIHILYLSKRLLKGGLTKPSHTFRRGERSSVPVHCLQCTPPQRPGRSGPAAPGPGRALRPRSSALRHPPRPGLRAAGTRRAIEPKMAPGPNKARSARGPGPHAPVTRRV